jgi:polar amino acid transport system substrate-binding protein
MKPWTRRGLAAAAAILPAAALETAAMSGAARAQGSGETTLDRVQRTKTLRISALPGEAPYFAKDLATGTWKGACIEMAKDIAKVFDAQLDYVEGTYATSVLDLQANKVDLAFALNPTPQRALAIGFTHPFITHPFGCLAKAGFNPKTWDELNTPDTRVIVDIGSLHEVAARRYCPKAQITAFKTRDEATLAFQSGRGDAYILAAMLGLSTIAKNPSLGPYHLLTGPLVALPSNFGVRWEPDSRFTDVLNAWIDFNRGTGQIREYLLDGLALNGVKRDDLPADLSF